MARPIAASAGAEPQGPARAIARVGGRRPALPEASTAALLIGVGVTDLSRLIQEISVRIYGAGLNAKSFTGNSYGKFNIVL